MSDYVFFINLKNGMSEQSNETVQFSCYDGIVEPSNTVELAPDEQEKLIIKSTNNKIKLNIKPQLTGTNDPNELQLSGVKNCEPCGIDDTGGEWTLGIRYKFNLRRLSEPAQTNVTVSDKQPEKNWLLIGLTSALGLFIVKGVINFFKTKKEEH